MEVIQGSRNLRLLLTSKSGKIKFTNQHDENATATLVAFRGWLTSGLPSMLKPFGKDLTNIRDEMLESVNNTIYLYTLL